MLLAPKIGGPVVITAPAHEVITPDELELASTIDADAATTASTDIEITTIAARIWAEAYTHRAFVTQTLEVTLDDFPPTSPSSGGPEGWSGGEILLPRPPLQSVTSIKYFDPDGNEQTWDAANYEVVTNRTIGLVRLGYNKDWPDVRSHPDQVTIRYVAGYGAPQDVPEPIKKAVLAIAGHLWDHPESTIMLARGETLPENELIRSLLATEKVPYFR